MIFFISYLHKKAQGVYPVLSPENGADKWRSELANRWPKKNQTILQVMMKH